MICLLRCLLLIHEVIMQRLNLVGVLQRSGSLARQLAAAAAHEQAPVPTSIVLKKKEKRLLVNFDTGETFSLPAEYLRTQSTGAQEEGRIVSGRRHVGVMSLEVVGQYGVRLQFDDMDSSGIYNYSYLHTLGREKMSRMREYIRLLRRHDLSRDPPARRIAQQAQQQQQQLQQQQPQPQQPAVQQRNRICRRCNNSQTVSRSGVEYWWCQLCAHYQALTDFDGDRRTCRVMLAKPNMRRNLMRRVGKGASGASLPPSTHYAGDAGAEAAAVAAVAQLLQPLLSAAPIAPAPPNGMELAASWLAAAGVPGLHQLPPFNLLAEAQQSQLQQPQLHAHPAQQQEQHLQPLPAQQQMHQQQQHQHQQHQQQLQQQQLQQHHLPPVSGPAWAQQESSPSYQGVTSESMRSSGEDEGSDTDALPRWGTKRHRSGPFPIAACAGAAEGSHAARYQPQGSPSSDAKPPNAGGARVSRPTATWPLAAAQGWGPAADLPLPKQKQEQPSNDYYPSPWHELAQQKRRQQQQQPHQPPQHHVGADLLQASVAEAQDLLAALRVLQQLLMHASPEGAGVLQQALAAGDSMGAPQALCAEELWPPADQHPAESVEQLIQLTRQRIVQLGGRLP
eukprot:scaffold4.g4964.t1